MLSPIRQQEGHRFSTHNMNYPVTPSCMICELLVVDKPICDCFVVIVEMTLHTNNKEQGTRVIVSQHNLDQSCQDCGRLLVVISSLSVK